MSIRSEAYKDWANDFLKSEAFKGHKAEAEDAYPTGTPISRTIEKIKAKISSPTVDLLINNLLYACYQANAALTITTDPAEMRREQFRHGHKLIGELRQGLNDVARLFESYPEVLVAALMYPDAPVGRHDRPAKKYNPSVPVEHLVNAIAPAVRKIVQAYKVSQMNEDITFSDHMADCAEGQFLHHHRLANRNSKPGRTKDYRRHVEDGLIFHLTYIFRYFTGGDKDPYCKASISKQGELIVGGSMIRLGEPNEAAVAHLVNAAMNRKFPKDAITGRDVKERLRGLLKPSKPSENDKLTVTDDLRRNPFSDIEFVGWPAPPK